MTPELRHHWPFNAIHPSTASKIDLIVCQDRPFSVEEFGRRQVITLPFGVEVAIVMPEDAILSKLEWARRARDSERQLTDVRGIIAMTSRVDVAYIERWASALGVLDLWTRCPVDEEMKQA